MKRAIRNSALAVAVLFALLLANLTYIQGFDVQGLSKNPLNPRNRLTRFSIDRGSILAGSGVDQIEIAKSRKIDSYLAEQTDVPPSTDPEVKKKNSSIGYQREYPYGELYAQVTGYLSPDQGSSSLERSYDDILQGENTSSVWRNFNNWINGKDRQGNNIVTSIIPKVQQTAFDAIGDSVGAAVALNPKNGEVIAMVSKPSWDPNVWTSTDRKSVVEAWTRLDDDPLNPRLNRATSELYPPGSTFKIITTSSHLEKGGSLSDLYKDPIAFELPGSTATIRNFHKGVCNDGNDISIKDAFKISCNTTFADIAVQDGSVQLIKTAESFGWNHEIPFDTQTATPSIPSILDPAQAAQSAIGQFDVKTSPLHMAMVTSAIANNGVMMKPHLVKSVTEYGGKVVMNEEITPLSNPFDSSNQIISARTAALVTEAMEAVVNEGTGRRARIESVRVAGKTGTAQRGEGQPPHAWFVAFAPVEDPQIAVAVIIEGGSHEDGSSTGGASAAPIAKEIIEAALGE